MTRLYGPAEGISSFVGFCMNECSDGRGRGRGPISTAALTSCHSQGVSGPKTTRRAATGAGFPATRLSGVQGSKSSKKESRVQIQDETSPRFMCTVKTCSFLMAPVSSERDSAFSRPLSVWRWLTHLPPASLRHKYQPASLPLSVQLISVIHHRSVTPTRTCTGCRVYDY